MARARYGQPDRHRRTDARSSNPGRSLWGRTACWQVLIDGGGPDAFGAVNAATTEEGRAVVRRYYDLGFEQVKLYSFLKPDVVADVAAGECRKVILL